jgi:hypothetical protein
VLQKHFNANHSDIAKTADQVQKTLKWRANMKPLELLKQKFNKSKFGGLGYVTGYGKGDEAKDPAACPQQVFTWNIYGGVNPSMTPSARSPDSSPGPSP